MSTFRYIKLKRKYFVYFVLVKYVFVWNKFRDIFSPKEIVVSSIALIGRQLHPPIVEGDPCTDLMVAVSGHHWLLG